MAIKSLNKLAFLVFVILTVSCSDGYEKADTFTSVTPRLFPDYTNVVFPINIAPANFAIEEEGDAYQAVFSVGKNDLFTCTNSSSDIRIPLDNWKELLKKAAGKDFFIRIGVHKDGKWKEYTKIRNSVSQDSIDSYLVYRLLYPGYELWNEMGIYQRNLSNFEESPIVENKAFGKQCVNCHTFCKNSPQTMMLHVRGKDGGTLIYRNGRIEKIKSTPQGSPMGATYAGWHPGGRYIAFSMNEVQQFFHSGGQKAIEVSDMAANMGVYDTERYVMLTNKYLDGKEYMETFPAWSPDGRYLYYCRGNAYKKGLPLDSLRYDLYRIPFNPDTGKLGVPECVFNATKNHKTVSLPRISPDGRYLMFVLFNYGTFSIWHSESDLYLMPLKDGKVRPIKEVNSKNVESFHTWSSTGKWFVFSSKRIDGLWARPYFSHFDPNTGKASKPFVLPQEDPYFYLSYMKTYNLPELITAPVSNGKDFLKAIPEKGQSTFLKVER